MMIFSILLYSYVLNAQSLEVRPEVVKTDSEKLINFNINNQSKTPLYCRKISIPNVQYKKEGEYFDSLEARVSDIFIDKNVMANKIQDRSDYLSELFKNNEGLELEIDKNSIVADCEVSDARLSWIYVIDDKTKCNSSAVEVVPFNIDFGNEALIKKEPLIKNVSDVNYKFYQNNFSRDALKVSSGSLYLQTDKAGVISSFKLKDFDVTQNESFAGSLWLDDNKFVFYTMDQGGLNIFRAQKENNGIFTISKGIQVYKFSEVFNGMEYDNKELIRLEMQRHLEKIKGSVLVYNVYNQDFDNLRVLFAVRLPSFTRINTMYDFEKNVWVKPVLQINNYDSSSNIIYKMLDINISDYTARAVNDLTLDRFKKELSSDDYDNALKPKTSESFKKFKVQSFNNKLSYTFGGDTKSMTGFCNIVQIYSDKIEAKKGRNIDAFFKGHVRLIDSVINNRYEEALELIRLGANVNLKDALGNNALLYSVEKSNNKFLKQLLASGAKPNESDEEGNTPLINEILVEFSFFNKYSTEVQQRMISSARANIKLLLEYGARTDLTNKKGKSAKDIASELGVYQFLNDMI